MAPVAAPSELFEPALANADTLSVPSWIQVKPVKVLAALLKVTAWLAVDLRRFIVPARTGAMLPWFIVASPLTVRVPEPEMTFAEAALSVSPETVAAFAPIAKVAAPLIDKAPVPMAWLAPRVTVPALTFVAPVSVLAALSVRVPVPILVKAPAPLPKVLASVTVLPFVSKVPPPVPKVIVLVEGSPVKPPPAVPSCNVPPKKFRDPAPSILMLETCSAP